MPGRETAVDALARLGAEEGYLVSPAVAAPDPGSAAPNQATAGQHLALAVRQAGGASGEMLWQFPLPQHLAGTDKRALLQHWNQLHGTEAEKQLLRQLVLALRTWRPDVVITDHPDAKKTDDFAGALVAEAMREAVNSRPIARRFRNRPAAVGLASRGV